MTGTSIDALDAALVRIEGAGLAMRASLVRGLTTPLGELAPRLRDIATQTPVTAGELASVSRAFSMLHVDAIRRLLAQAGDAPRIDLICAHGQTVHHAPPVSWQMLTPAVIAHEIGAAVVFDLRAADLAAGGQGAPITPLADWVLFRHVLEPATAGIAPVGSAPEPLPTILNLGGFCNITQFAAGKPGQPGPDAIRGRDVCACNHLLDTIARRVMGVPFDEGGKSAMAADVDHEALDDLLGVLTSQAAARRSLGTGDDDAMSWIGRHRTRISGGSLAATACEAIAEMVDRATRDDRADVPGIEGRILLAGGGVKNAALVRAIASCCSSRVETTASAGVPPEFREAMAMAVLGALCQDRVPITLPQVTGVIAASEARGSKPVRAPISGSWVMV